MPRISCQRLRDADRQGDLRVLGPAPAPLGRLRGEYRAQLLIKGTNRKRMREALQAALAARPDLQRRTSSMSIRCRSALIYESSASDELHRLNRRGREAEHEHHSATAARIRRVRSSGTCSSKTRGWCGPNMKSMTIISTVQTIQLVEKNADSTIATPMVANVTYVDRRPSTAYEMCPPSSWPMGNRFSAVASSPNQAPNAIGCMFSE